MGGFLSYIWRREDPKTPIKGVGPRVVNLVTKHFRGILGTIVPIALGPVLLKRDDPKTAVMFMWVWMFWSFLIQPVAIPATGLIPVFLLPMTCTMSSDLTCPCYMNEGITMFILANMVLLLWNNSGLDRRLIMWFLCAGDTPNFSARKLVLKCCGAGFILSIFCNKLIVANIMLQYVTNVMTSQKATTSKAVDADYDELRYILNNAIQTSCSIGGAAIIHSSYTTLAFRAIFYSYSVLSGFTWVDSFNFMEYSQFAFPLCIALFVLNMGYHLLLATIKTGKPVSKPSLIKIRNALLKEKKEIRRKVTLHEWMTLFFSIVTLALYFTRWNKYMGGWAMHFEVYDTVPGVRDATVAAGMTILLHCLPNGFRFVKIWFAKKRSDIGNPKPQSGILWWRFVDKNIVYGYIFLIGSGVALMTAISHTGYNDTLPKTTLGKIFGGQSTMIFLLLVCLVSVILSNVMSSVAAIVVLLPFVMNVVPITTTTALEEDNLILRDSGGAGGGGTPAAAPVIGIPNLEKVYLGALAVGLSGSFSFMNPFAYTPAFFCFHTGKVPRKKLALYGLGSAIICCGMLFAFVAFIAPVLWSPGAFTQKLARTYGVIIPTEKPPGSGGDPPQDEGNPGV